MTARGWLPKEAFDGEGVKAVLAPPIVAWSAAWIARGEAQVARVRARGPAAGSAVRGARVAAELSGKRALLDAALDVRLNETVPSECDNRLLDAFAKDVVADLVARLDTYFAMEDADGPSLWATVALGRNDILELAFAESLLVPLLKARLGAPRTGGKPLVSRSKALRGTRLTAEACLGRVDIALNDLQELAVGDVLVVDHGLNDPVSLKLAGSPQAFARGALRSTGGQLTICL